MKACNTSDIVRISVNDVTSQMQVQNKFYHVRQPVNRKEVSLQFRQLHYLSKTCHDCVQKASVLTIIQHLITVHSICKFVHVRILATEDCKCYVQPKNRQIPF